MTVTMSDLQWLSEPQSGAGEATAVWAAQTLLDAGVGTVDGGQVEALYLATEDGGARQALAFWSAAQQTGLARAAPAAFPWTLSTSATGRVSQVLQITGPCTTYVGGADAVTEATLAARADLADGVVRSALVVTLNGVGPIDPSGSGLVRLRLSATLLHC